MTLVSNIKKERINNVMTNKPDIEILAIDCDRLSIEKSNEIKYC
jgi:hypothetical protein